MSMFCSWCDHEIYPYDRYLTVCGMTICESCIRDQMEEYDPDSEYEAMIVHESIERSLGVE